LPGKYNDGKRNDTRTQDDMFLNNGNDMSTKIAPESDRGEKITTDDKKTKKRSKTKGKAEVEDTDTKKKRKKKSKRLVMNVAQTKYQVVRYVAKNIYKMRLTYNDDEDWDICW
jgi:hypothetical protein